MSDKNSHDDTQSYIIARIATALDVGASMLDVYDMLKSEELSDSEAYLVFKAAEILHKSRSEL